MPFTINDNIPWQESNQMSFAVGADGSPHSASRWALVEWDLVKDFIRAMCGYSELKATGGVHRVLPEPHPLFEWMYARNCRFVRQTDEPNEQGNLGSLTYPQVELEVVYSSLEYAVQSDEEAPAVGVGEVATELYRYVTRHKSLAVHAQPLPPTLLEFVPAAAEAPLRVPEPGSIFLPSATLKYRWLEIPAVMVNGSPELPTGLRANIDTYIGSVNSELFDGRYSKGSLLMLAPEEPAFRWMANGELCADLTLVWEVRGGNGDYDAVTSPTPDWAHLIRADGLYHKVRQVSDHAKAIYPLQDHRLILWPF